jgi:hypothetical protein
MPGAHDDLVNAACGAVVLVGVNPRRPIALSDAYTTQEELDAIARERNEDFKRQLFEKGSWNL